jgi:hypothetical protein
MCNGAASGPRLNAVMRQNVFLIGFGVFDKHIEVATLLEGRAQGVDQLEFGRVPPASPILFDQKTIGKFDLRILVQHLHVRMRRRAVEVKVVFLDVFAVIALRAGQTEETLLDDRITFIPQRDGHADVLIAIAHTGQTVFVPAICTAARVIVREVIPCLAGRAVVFAHSPPGAFAEIRPPLFPVGLARF